MVKLDYKAHDSSTSNSSSGSNSSASSGEISIFYWKYLVYNEKPIKSTYLQCKTLTDKIQK